VISVTYCPGCEGRAIQQDSFLARCPDCQLVFDNPARRHRKSAIITAQMASMTIG
jgi:hypothetical protein